MPKLYLPTIMRANADGQATVQLSGETVSEVIGDLVSTYPNVRPQLLDAEGHVQRHINVYLNNEDIRALDGDKTPVTANDELTVLPAMAGGA
jgi:molybdopterin synthase sulfur carrier subunit